MAEMVPIEIAEAMAQLGPAKVREIRSLMEAIAPVIAQHLHKLVDRCAKLDDRIKQLEDRPSLEYRSIWSEHEQYTPGQFVTDHGSVFYCRCLTRERPSAGSSDWQLAVKRGRDGKDATR
jgi:hypothetical protein